MAGVDVGGSDGGRRRSVSIEINMVPMIDLLMVTISFLLITAVWAHMSRLDANANVPHECAGADCNKPDEPQKTLHVDMKDPTRFTLSWRRGNEALDRFDVPRTRVADRYPELAAKIGETWKTSGDHRAPDDHAHDRAVLHADDAASYADLVAVMDAIRAVDRPENEGSRILRAPAFDLVFSMN
jgi:biopolymer transport protein ExbD